MNEAQKLTVKKFEDVWVVDHNFQNEPIIYTHKKNNPSIEEYVIDKEGKAYHTASYPYTVKLQRELSNYKEM